MFHDFIEVYFWSKWFKLFKLFQTVPNCSQYITMSKIGDVTVIIAHLRRAASRTRAGVHGGVTLLNEENTWWDCKIRTNGNICMYLQIFYLKGVIKKWLVVIVVLCIKSRLCQYKPNIVHMTELLQEKLLYAISPTTLTTDTSQTIILLLWKQRE